MCEHTKISKLFGNFRIYLKIVFWMDHSYESSRVLEPSLAPGSGQSIQTGACGSDMKSGHSIFRLPDNLRANDTLISMTRRIVDHRLREKRKLNCPRQPGVKQQISLDDTSPLVVAVAALLTACTTALSAELLLCYCAAVLVGV